MCPPQAYSEVKSEMRKPYTLFKCDSLLVFKFILVQSYHLLRSGYKQKRQMPGMLVTHAPSHACSRHW